MVSREGGRLRGWAGAALLGATCGDGAGGAAGCVCGISLVTEESRRACAMFTRLPRKR